MIHVVNKSVHTGTPTDFYIGRGSALGNPFTHGPLNRSKAEFRCLTREDAIESYEKYLRDKIAEKDKDICNILNRIYKTAIIGEAYLVCYCAPKPCHGEVIKRIVDEKLNERMKQILRKK